MITKRRNITLSLPDDVLRRVKRLAADRETSVSAILVELLSNVDQEDRRYAAARRRFLASMAVKRHLNIGDRPSWTRDELHER